MTHDVSKLEADNLFFIEPEKIHKRLFCLKIQRCEKVNIWYKNYSINVNRIISFQDAEDSNLTGL